MSLSFMMSTKNKELKSLTYREKCLENSVNQVQTLTTSSIRDFRYNSIMITTYDGIKLWHKLKILICYIIHFNRKCGNRRELSIMVALLASTWLFFCNFVSYHHYISGYLFITLNFLLHLFHAIIYCIVDKQVSLNLMYSSIRLKSMCET